MQCEQVLGLGDFKSCPQDPGCPGTGGSAPTATCTDGKKNGDESDIDCGGTSCAKCVDGKGCDTGADCDSKVCSGGTCLAPACDDKVMNGDETDADCGGATCAKCDAGKGCAGDADCEGGSCGADGKCAATCTDGAKNGDESDIDCGGTSCGKCAIDAGCATGPDCETGVCQASKCVSNFVWAKKYGSATTFTGLVVDTEESIFVTGSTTGPLDFGNGPMSPSAGSAAFLAKLGPAGNDLWSEIHDNSGASTDYGSATALALDHEECVLTAGEFAGTIKLSPTMALTGGNMFVAGLDKDLGYPHWAYKATASALNHWVNGLAVDPSNNVLVTGQFTSTLTWNGATFGFSASGPRDIFLIKTDANGTLSLFKHFGVSSNHGRAFVASDQSSNIILAGAFWVRSTSAAGTRSRAWDLA
ncbi:Multiple EGF-like-domain protein 3 precursor [Minicystis rosea]|nr:Multiple EGF-like-domain protein 3 precursor [Minicystis rosea]